ncbi:MAG: hypothetical protein J5995_02525 [Muribaculaceae bacterium]|nr:hypothetical protein [Muribaculaceae bacterium]
MISYSKIPIFILILSAIVIVSCSHHRNADLMLAENIMEDNPDSALVLLDNVDSESLGSSDYPYFALLYTQARIKTGEPVLSDSLVDAAFAGLKDVKSGNWSIRAYFYKGMVLYDSGHEREAMRYFLKSYELAKKSNDWYWIAKSSEMISDTFFNVYNYTEAEKYSKEAIVNFGKSGRISNQRYAICDLATIYLNCDIERAVCLLDSLWNVCNMEQPRDSALLDYIMYPRAIAYVNSEKLEDISAGQLAILDNDFSRESAIENVIVKSRILSLQDSLKSVKILLDGADAYDLDKGERAHLMYASYMNAKNSGNYEHAVSLTDSLLQLQSLIAENILSESMAGVQRDFYFEEAVIEKNKSKELKLILYSAGTIALLVIAAIILINRQRSKLHRMELEANIAELIHLKEKNDLMVKEKVILTREKESMTATIEDLSGKLNEKSALILQNSKAIEYLFKDRWKILNSLFNEYFNLSESDKLKTVILNDIEKELKNLQTKKSIAHIEEMVNRYMGEIMSKLRNECKKLNEDDYTFISLVYAGFSVRTICLLMKIKYKLFYLKRERLIKRIAASDAPDKDLFVEKLKNHSA